MKSLERVKHWQEFLSPTSDTSTQDSKPIPREEILQAKGKLYQLHKQKMKQKLENDLVIMIPFAPVINPKHDNKENQEKVENRLIRSGIHSKSKIEQKRKQIMKNQETETFKPVFQSEIPDFPTRLLNIQKIYDKKIEDLQIQKLENESKLNKSPKICKKSNEIVQKLNRDEDIKERLYNSAKAFKEKMKAKVLLEELRLKIESNPKITPLAKKINRDGNISERLSRYKDYYGDRLNQLSQKYRQEIVLPKSRSNSTARERLLRPRSQSIPYETHPFRPSLSPNSLKLAEKLEKSSSRLLKIPSSHSLSSKTPYIFKPSINPNSVKLDNRKNQSSERWESLYSLKDLKKTQSIQNISDENPINECTFKPFIKPDPKAFVTRVTGWRKEVDDKINRQKENLLEDSLRKCTFSPEIGHKSRTEGKLLVNNKRPSAYSNKYKQVSANEFLDALEKLRK